MNCVGGFSHLWELGFSEEGETEMGMERTC